MIDTLLWLLTSLPVMALAGGAGLLGVAGAALGLFSPLGNILARYAGIAMLALFCFIAGYRTSDDRQAIAALRSRLAVVQNDLRAEKAARAEDLKAIAELAAEKDRAERSNRDLQDLVAKLPEAERCIATPDRIRQLHGN